IFGLTEIPNSLINWDFGVLPVIISAINTLEYGWSTPEELAFQGIRLSGLITNTSSSRIVKTLLSGEMSLIITRTISLPTLRLLAVFLSKEVNASCYTITSLKGLQAE